MTDADAFPGVAPELRAALVRKGYSKPTAVQAAVIGHDATNANLRISSETGSGKTVAIGIVIGDELLAKVASGEPRPGPLALIITPTRELASQVRDELTWLFADVPSARVQVVTGGTDVRREQHNLKRRPAILVGTPGRLLDHIRTKAVDCSAVGQVVLDEADRMLDMGFREELEAIVETLPDDRRSHLVSATFSRQVSHFADKFQKDAVHLEGTRLGQANKDIEHSAYMVRPRELYAGLVNTLLTVHGKRCLVFVQRRTDAAEVAEKLSGDGFSAMPLSGDLPQAQRSRTLNAFRQGVVQILVATDVAARGIDVADIATVVHVEVPFDSETYVHRSGRTGRAGQKGRSILLIPPQAERRMRRLLRDAKVDVKWEALPAPAKIKKQQKKQARTELFAMLAAEPDLSEGELEYAGTLLEQHEPNKVVAQLLRLAAPRPICEPKDVSPIEARTERPMRKETDYVNFAVNWGHRKGATAGRLIALACRRGNITSQSIGIINVDSKDSTLQVAVAAAEAFEREVQKPDSRDPSIVIRRTEAPAASPSRRHFNAGRKRAPGWRGSRYGRADSNPRGDGRGRPGGGPAGGGPAGRGPAGGGPAGGGPAGGGERYERGAGRRQPVRDEQRASGDRPGPRGPARGDSPPRRPKGPAGES